MINVETAYTTYENIFNNRKKFYDTELLHIEKYYNVLEKCRTTAYKDLESALINIRNYEKYNIQDSNRRKLSLDEFSEHLNVLKDKYDFQLIHIAHSFSSLKFISRAKIQETNFKTRTNLEVDLGLFLTEISIDSDLRTPYKISYATAPIYFSSFPRGENKPVDINGRNAFHPHINESNGLCIGSYRNDRNCSFLKDLQNFDIISLFYNLAAVLCRYNGASLNFPDATIDRWVGFQCGVCGQFTDKNIRCSRTHQIIHEDCGVIIDKKLYSCNVVKSCSECNVDMVDFIPVDSKNLCTKCWEKI